MLGSSTHHHAGVASKRRQVRNIALPAEHGVWGFWLEPSLLGLLMAPSLAGLCLVFAVLAALLAQQPLVLYLSDLRRAKRYPRTRLAFGFTLAYGIISLSFGVASLFLADSFVYLVPIAIMVPFILYQFKTRLAHQNRQLLPELLGVAALGAPVASVVLIQETLLVAFALWFIMLARSLPSVLYVRARLRLEREESINRWPTLLSSGAAILLALYLASQGLTPVITAVVFLLLFVRAALGLSGMRFKLKAKHIGMLELVFGLLLVLSTAFAA